MALDRLDLSLGGGELELKQVHLKVESLNLPVPLKGAMVRSLRLKIDWTDWWGGEKKLELEGVELELDNPGKPSPDHLEDIFYDALAMSIYQGEEIDEVVKSELEEEESGDDSQARLWKDLVSRVHIYCDQISIKQDDLCLKLIKLHMWRNFEEEAVVTVEQGIEDPLIRMVAIEEMVLRGAEGQELAKVNELLATISRCQGQFSFDLVADKALRLKQIDGLPALYTTWLSDAAPGNKQTSHFPIKSLALILPWIQVSKPDISLIDVDFQWVEGKILLLIQAVESSYGQTTTRPALRVSPMADVADCLQLQLSNLKINSTFDWIHSFIGSGGEKVNSTSFQLPFSLPQSLDLTCPLISSTDIELSSLHLYLTQQACSLSFDQATMTLPIESMKLSIGPSTTAIRFKKAEKGPHSEAPPFKEFFEFEPVNRVASLESMHRRQEQLMILSELTIQVSLGELSFSMASMEGEHLFSAAKNVTGEKRGEPWISLRLFNRKCNLELPNDYRIVLDDGCLFLCLSRDRDIILFDYRVNLLEMSIPKLLQAHRYLYCSLDPQERNLVISGDLKSLNVQTTGMLLDLSLFALLQEREEKITSGQLIPEFRQFGNHLPQLNLEFRHCAVQPQVPSEWQPMMPHVVHAGEIHIKIDHSMTLILALVKNAHLMLCPRAEFLKSVQGVYSDGHQYWTEHGHVTVGKLNWGKLELENYSKLVADFDEIGAELCSDSMALLRHLLDHYLIIMEKDEGGNGVIDTEGGGLEEEFVAPFKMDEDIFDPWTPKSAVSSKPSKAATIPDPIVGEINIPSSSEFPLGQSFGEPLILEEDYFSPAPNCIVNEEPKLRVKVGRLYLRLIEGNHYQPLWKRNSVTTVHEEEILASYSFNDLRSPTEIQSAFSSVGGAQTSIIASGQGSLSQSPSRSSHQAWSTFTRHHSRRASHLLQKDKVELQLDGIELTLQDAPSDLKARVRVNEITALDGIQASRWRSLLTRQLPDRRLTSGMVPMLRIDLERIPSTTEEWNLFVSVEPLRMFIDQHTLNFLLQILNFDASELHAKISDIRLCLDYKPHHLKGAPSIQSAMMNLFPLEKAAIHLPSVHLRGVRGLSQLFLELLNAWMPSLQADAPQALMRSLAPVRCLMGLGGGVAQLILLPTGTVDFNDGKKALKDTALHTLQLVQRVSKGGRVILEHVDDIFGGDSIDSRRRFRDADANLPDRLHSSLQSISLSVQHSLYTVVAVPIHDWQQEGGSGALKAIIRAVPVAVLGPLREGLGGMETIVEGLGGWLEPEMREEAHQKYKR